MPKHGRNYCQDFIFNKKCEALEIVPFRFSTISSGEPAGSVDEENNWVCFLIFSQNVTPPWSLPGQNPQNSRGYPVNPSPHRLSCELSNTWHMFTGIWLNSRWLLIIFKSMKVQIWVRPKAGPIYALAYCPWTPPSHPRPFDSLSGAKPGAS